MSDVNFETLKALIVDDQEDSRELLKDMLTQIGLADISESSDGKEALKRLDEEDKFFDIVICDWNMPTMTGVELLRQIRTVHPDMPFLMVTGRQDMGSVVEAKESGVTAYIGKPFTIEQLEAKIRVSCAKRSISQSQ